jgi:hypothetical protein
MLEDACFFDAFLMLDVSPGTLAGREVELRMQSFGA